MVVTCSRGRGHSSAHVLLVLVQGARDYCYHKGGEAGRQQRLPAERVAQAAGVCSLSRWELTTARPPFESWRRRCSRCMAVVESSPEAGTRGVSLQDTATQDTLFAGSRPMHLRWARPAG